MTTFYITFGQQYRTHPHPVLGTDSRLADGWYEVTAVSLDDAYDQTNARIGSAFAFAYDEQPDPALFTAGRIGSLDPWPIRRECDHCSGDGRVAHAHPRWGQHDCEEDYVEDDCPSCGGAGFTLTYPEVRA